MIIGCSRPVPKIPEPVDVWLPLALLLVYPEGSP